MRDIEAIKKEISKRLKTCRMEKGLTQEKLSEKIGMETKSYANIEGGSRFFSIDILIKIMIELEVSADYILMGYTSNDSPLNEMLKKLDPQDISRAETILMAFCEAVVEANDRNK